MFSLSCNFNTVLSRQLKPWPKKSWPLLSSLPQVNLCSNYVFFLLLATPKNWWRKEWTDNLWLWFNQLKTWLDLFIWYLFHAYSQCYFTYMRAPAWSRQCLEGSAVCWRQTSNIWNLTDEFKCKFWISPNEIQMHVMLNASMGLVCKLSWYRVLLDQRWHIMWIASWGSEPRGNHQTSLNLNRQLL